MILQLYDGSTTNLSFPVSATWKNGGGIQFVFNATAGFFSNEIPPSVWTLSFSSRLLLYAPGGTMLCGAEYSGSLSLVYATKAVTVESFSHTNIGARPILPESRILGSSSDAAVFKNEIVTAVVPSSGAIRSFGCTVFSDVFVGLVPDGSYIVRSNSSISHNLELGGLSAGSRMAYPPSAVFTTEVEELLVDFNGGASRVSRGLSDPDSDNRIVSYEWAFGDGETGTGVVTEHDYLDDGTYNPSLKVTDIYGGFGSSTQRVALAGATRCGAIIDASNAITSAIGLSSGVAVNRFLGGPTSKKQIATLANARYPTLFQNGARGESDRYYLILKNRSTALWNLLASDDKGATWGDVVGVPFNNTYRAATACGTIEGVLIAVGVKTGSGEIYSRRSFDGGETWDAPVMVFPSGSVRFVQVAQMSSAGGTRLMVTDGITFFRFSDNMGETWGAS